jgi:hypothetical protein
MFGRMIETITCPACDSRRGRSWPSRIAPFICEYLGVDSRQRCRLCQCYDCRLRFYNLRYTLAEMQHLYAGYRGERYTKTRLRHEPSYDATFHGDDGAIRRASLAAFIKPHLGDLSSVPVLDFGGDRGQFIPDFFIGPRYVHEMTERPLHGGASLIQDLAEIAPRSLGFVIAAHLIEHLPEPVETLNEIRPLLSKHEAAPPGRGVQLTAANAPETARRFPLQPGLASRFQI